MSIADKGKEVLEQGKALAAESAGKAGAALSDAAEKGKDLAAGVQEKASEHLSTGTEAAKGMVDKVKGGE